MSPRPVVLAAVLALAYGCTSHSTIERFKAKHREFRLDATYLPPISVIGTSLPEGTVDTESGGIEFEQVLLDAYVPIPQDEDRFVIVGALAGVRSVQFDDVPFLADDDLHRYALRLGYGAFLSDDLVVQAYWQPSVYSDMDGSLTADDYRLWYGTVLGIWRSSEAWFWKAGLQANDAADTGVIPLAGFAWHFAPEWSVQVLVPRDATLVFDHDPWLVTTGLLLESDEYHVRSPDALDLESDVHVHEVYAHLTAERRVAGDVYALLRGGSTLTGDWDWGYGSGTGDFSGEIDTDLFFALGLSYRF